MYHDAGTTAHAVIANSLAVATNNVLSAAVAAPDTPQKLAALENRKVPGAGGKRRSRRPVALSAPAIEVATASDAAAIDDPSKVKGLPNRHKLVYMASICCKGKV